jgi:hypothetical protein
VARPITAIDAKQASRRSAFESGWCMGANFSRSD